MSFYVWETRYEKGENDVGKVKLTREQASRIERIKKGGIISAIRFHLNGGWTSETNQCLTSISDKDFIKAVWEPDSYEIEPEYKVGDWVVVNHHGDKWVTKIAKIMDGGEIVYVDETIYVDNLQYFGFRHLTHATPEEIKAEKERRLWKTIGREVGELKEGDVGVCKGGSTWSMFPHVKARYRNDDLKGIYPAESFISFGGDTD